MNSSGKPIEPTKQVEQEHESSTESVQGPQIQPPTEQFGGKPPRLPHVGKVFIAAITVLAALYTLTSAFFDIRQRFADSDNVGYVSPLLSHVKDWARDEFSITSTILIATLAGLFLLVWYYKSVGLRDANTILDERDDELLKEATARDRLVRELEEERQSRIETDRENGRWHRALKHYLAVPGISRYTYYKSIHDKPIQKRTQVVEQRKIAENVFRTVLNEIEQQMSLGGRRETVLCCVKFVEGDEFDGERFRCLYPVIYEDDLQLEAEYNHAPRVGSLPGWVISAGREQYVASFNDAAGADSMEPPIDFAENEKKLVKKFDITGMAAYPIRIHNEYNETPVVVGVFFAFLRAGQVPTDETRFRAIGRLFSEHLTDVVQFTRSVAQRPIRTRTDGKNQEGQGQS